MTPLPPDHERLLKGNNLPQIITDNPFGRPEPMTVHINGRRAYLIEDPEGAISIAGDPRQYRELSAEEHGLIPLNDIVTYTKQKRRKNKHAPKTRMVKGKEYHPTKGWR